MERYLNVTKSIQSARKVDTNNKKITDLEHIMHVATTASTHRHDIWQSASTGHQVSEAGGKSVSYNDARLAKLQAQFPPNRNTLKRKRSSNSEEPVAVPLAETKDAQETLDSEHIALYEYDTNQNKYHPAPASPSSLQKTGSGIFSDCVFYLDGYMGPTMSDHSLRRVLTQNGGTLSLYLKKTRITHVLLSSKGSLANNKIKKEAEGSRNSVKFVKVDWVFKCLEVGHRVGEWEYSIDKLQGNNRSVVQMITPRKPSNTSSSSSSSLSQRRVINSSSTSESDDSQAKARLDLLAAEEGERLNAMDR